MLIFAQRLKVRVGQTFGPASGLSRLKGEAHLANMIMNRSLKRTAEVERWKREGEKDRIPKKRSHGGVLESRMRIILRIARGMKPKKKVKQPALGL